VLLGPSGCGKTTTLRMIGGFETPSAGEIWLEGKQLSGQTLHVAPDKRDIGFVFQDYALFPHLTVAQNVSFGLRGMSADARSNKVDEVLTLVGLAGFGERWPEQLSGGEQQRVALARSLAVSPKMLLLDEPFSNLDKKRREQMCFEVRALLKSQNIAAMLVTHNQEEAMMLGDRIGIMNEGQLLQVGTPQELYTKPETAFVAQFLGRTNLLEGDAEGDVVSCSLGRHPLSAPFHGEVMLSVRPESLTLSKDTNTGVEGVIRFVEYRGHFSFAHVELGALILYVRVDNALSWAEGERVGVSVDGQLQRVRSV